MCGCDETIHSAYQRSQARKSELGAADEADFRLQWSEIQTPAQVIRRSVPAYRLAVPSSQNRMVKR
jgi:hypothetical protein